MKSNFKSIIEAQTPVLVDFFADWCGPCKALAPILKEVKASLGDQVKIVKIDVDKNQPLSQEFQVRGVPTLILFKSGKPVWRQSGVVPKEQLLQTIQQYF
ncbi:thioredoxin [Croceiramulus getboli]|nr:thioredoxin [Flavobacteriaceae bacterium YJPT1-3]